MTCLIIVVASWATASPGGKDDKKKDDKDKKGTVYAEQDLPPGVVVESHKGRYSLYVAGSRGTENEKIMIIDTWDFANTFDAWMLLKPHTSSPCWARMKIDKKKR